MAMTPGFSHAGYYAPDCEQFRGNVERGDPVKYSGHDEGWRHVGFTDPTCVDFEQPPRAVPVVSSRP